VGHYWGKGFPSSILFLFLLFSMVKKACLWWYILAISAAPNLHKATGLEGSLVILWMLLAMEALVGPRRRLPKEREPSLKCSMNVGNPP
jgi:hypothetical protein